jgi:hypothetical protein
MDDFLSQRRQAENEVIFRGINEKVSTELVAIKDTAEEEGLSDLVPEIDLPVLFYCECSDENCRLRISLKPSIYAELHKNRSQFIVLPGHEVPTIEKIIYKNENYLVVEKNIVPPKSDGNLNPTTISNV